jgi:aminomethyltransferase
MKETPLTPLHIKAGAKMAEFAGYNMPIEYTGITEEHLNVRQHVGIFDVAHMGDIWVKGPNAEAFLQHVTSNDVAALTDGKIQYSCFPNDKGGIKDDFLNYRIDGQTYLLVVNAANLEKDWKWLCEHAAQFDIHPGKELYDASGEISQFAVQGPEATKVIQKLVDEPIMDMQYYTFRKVDIAGVKQAILSITGYTGAGGCEIYVANEDAPRLWEAILEAGKEFHICRAGLGARDTLRTEMGFCLYGNDITEETTPLEAGLGWITKLKDGKDMIAKDILLKQKADGVTRKLVAFEMVDKGIPRHGYPIVDGEGNEVGQVTSGTMSPCLKLGIGMGYVPKALSKVDTEILVQIRNKAHRAKVVKLPFYKG